MVDPNTYTCRMDPRFAMWGRHERASDGILIPQAKITLRSGAVGGHTAFKIFADPDVSIGVPGDVVISPTTEIDAIWNTCDQMWGGPTPQPKGVMVISAHHLLNRLGAGVGLGFGVVGSVTRPYMVVADPDVGHELNERALAYWVCRVLNVTPDTLPGSLMNRMELTGVTLTASQCNEARSYLAANPILDPPHEPTNALARVAAVFHDPRAAARPFLGLGKILTTDSSPVRGDLSFCLATQGPIPTGTDKLTYWILLDRDNNPETGAVPDDLVPGRPMRGVDFVCEVRLQGTNVVANLYEPSEFGFFVPVLLGPGLITAAIRQTHYEIIEPFRDYQGPVQFPAFAEIDFRIAYAALASAGLGNPNRDGLFLRGMRIQAVAEMPGVNTFDMAPNEGAVQNFPRIDFPTIALPALVKRGERMVVSVDSMPPNARLKCMLGPQMLSIDAFTDAEGSAQFAAVIPQDVVSGPRLVTVGVADPENSVTADGMVLIDSAGTLKIARDRNNAQLSWRGDTYVLQSALQLPGTWRDVDAQPTTPDGVNFGLLIPAKEKKEFFRLRPRN
jgi:hypothetical protein